MINLLLKRLAQAVFVVWAILTVVFILVRASGDPVTLFINEDTTPEQIARVRSDLGLDQPLAVQYGKFLVDSVQGKFGDSLRSRQPAMNLVLERLPASLQLIGAAVLFAVLVGIPLGTLAALNSRTWIDNAATSLALLGQAVPSFWLGTMLVMVVAVQLQWLPTSGRGSWLHLVLPTITLGTYIAARTTAFVRNGLLETMRQDFVRTAVAKGLSRTQAIISHAFRHVGVAVITLLALDIGGLLAGSVVTETLFAWSGISRLLITSVTNRDFPVVQAATVVLAVIVVLINLIVDLLYGLLDPRIRVE